MRSLLLHRCRPAPAAVLALALAGCDRGASPTTGAATTRATGDAAPWFQDDTATAGIDFTHDAGPTGNYFFPQIAGSGAAVFDFDGDGRLDLYLIHNGGPASSSTNRLYRQVEGGHFVDVSAGSGLDVAGYGMGAAAGDVNNDGRVDLCVTEYGRVRLFLNNGNGTFTSIGEQAGVSSLSWGTSAAFLDYDRDGWLDLVVVNYVDYDPGRWCANPDARRDYCGPNSFPGTASKLWRNLGPQTSGAVRFKDVTAESGFAAAPGPGLGVFCADFDGDRWPDVFVANDGKPNHLWINQRDGTFKEQGVERGVAYNCVGQAEANMGVAVGDVNGDALFDLFITHLTEERNTLWTQGPQGLFQDQTAGAGLLTPKSRGTGFGTVLSDFDHDGAADLAVVNGRVKRGPVTARRARPTTTGTGAASFWEPYLERNQLFRNDGGGRFHEISAHNAPLCDRPGVWRGLACADFDSDGAVDLLATTLAGEARLLRNVAPKRGHWLAVRAVDPALRRDAQGAQITVEAGGRRWVRWCNPGYSYLCSNDPRAHFGLGNAARVDSVHVVWPDGKEEAFPAPQLDREVVLCKGEGT